MSFTVFDPTDGPAAVPARDDADSHLLCLHGRTPDGLRLWARNVARSLAARR